MCMSTPKPPPVAKLASTPMAPELATRVEANAEVEATQSGERVRRSAETFNLKLPSSFQIPL